MTDRLRSECTLSSENWGIVTKRSRKVVSVTCSTFYLPFTFTRPAIGYHGLTPQPRGGTAIDNYRGKEEADMARTKTLRALHDWEGLCFFTNQSPDGKLHQCNEPAVAFAGPRVVVCAGHKPVLDAQRAEQGRKPWLWFDWTPEAWVPCCDYPATWYDTHTRDYYEGQ